MRNLRVSSLIRHELDLQAAQKEEAKTHIRAIAIDPQTANIYSTTSSISSSSSTLVNLDLWQLTPAQLHLAAFSTPISRRETNRHDSQQIVSLDHLSDGGSFVNNEPALCIVSAGGDIALLALSEERDEDGPALPEIVGSVEQGILAARWSPDEELLILVTAQTPAELAEDGRPKGSTLLIMTRDFEVLLEEVLQTDDFGEERPITLGWGSKSTQFHGSEGKQVAAAAAEAQLQTEKSSRGPLVEDDDLLPKVSWRGDSNIFVVSSVEAQGSSHHRIIRTFSKTGSLLATSDPESTGVSHVLAFKPTGILMATTQRIEDGHNLAFFERNGLPKGGFPLKDSKAKVREIAWNCDGTLLSIWLDSKVQIWSSGNYHWYLKQEIEVDSQVTCMRWHSEQPFDFYMATTRSVVVRSFIMEACVSISRSPNDAACAAVVDGSKILLTPFRIQNIPPPMCSMTLDLPEGSVPVDLAWADVSLNAGTSAGLLAVLSHPSRVALYVFEWGNLNGRISIGGRKLPTPRLLHEFDFGVAARQIAVSASRREDVAQFAVGILASEGRETLVVASSSADLSQMKIGEVTSKSLALGRSTGRTLVASSFVRGTFEPMRQIYIHEEKQMRNVLEENVNLPTYFPRLMVLKGEVENTNTRVIGLTDNGRLYLNHQLLAKDATSFTMTDHNIVWTNAAHEARFLPVPTPVTVGNDDVSPAPPPSEPVSLGRRIERGSRIVTAVPSAMSLVLQMPRGNLETIAPRPLILEVIKRNLDHKRYGAAFRICRTHRLDMNLLVDYNRVDFLANIGLFVKQVQDVEFLNLFLSSLREEDVTKTLYKPLGAALVVENSTAEPPHTNKVNAICDSIRVELEGMNESSKYINSILTTYIRKSPPDYESGLTLLQKLKQGDTAMADEACKYVIFLTDADKLFDAALGMYDFTLPLLVAQHSPRKDPREYLPFLRELRNIQPVEMQRFRIDEILKRWSKALGWIVKAGEAYFDQSCQFVLEHELYSDALREYTGNPSRLKVIQEMYGDWLQEQHRFKEAGILFVLCDKHRKAIDANVKAGSWREAFEIAASQKDIKGDIIVLARRVATSLGNYGRNVEAATVCIDYLQDVEEGVTYLCKDMDYVEAKRIVSLHNRLDLLETHVRPSLMENSETLLEEIGEMSDQGHKQFVRLEELNKKKKENPEEYYPDVDANGEQLDETLSQAFTMFSRFTRYSAFTRNGGLGGGGAAGGGPGSTMSAFTMATNRTRKSKKKDIKKAATGKKGSIFEEDYIFESIQKLLDGKLQRIQKDVGNILLHFARIGGGPLTEKYHRRAKELTTALQSFEKSMTEKAEFVWKETNREEEEMESQRIKAIEEAISLGVSWNQLQSNGLFAPQLQRKKIQVSPSTWQLPVLQYL
ncbi:hypothetical protein CBS101457_002894 [Exobasidium rhododendri]|nr:hypothetical protein CBS101457_002894 [Exobasidium rhododendri]